MEAKRLDIHAVITEQIVAMLDRARKDGTAAGAFRLPWHCPAGNTMRPVNVASGRLYRGVNILALWAAAEEKGYAAGVWGTYRQWSAAGAQVRRGEKASFVVIYRELARPEDGGGERDLATDERPDAGPRCFARASPVFAAEQLDGWTGADRTPPDLPGAAPVARAEAFVAATGATVRHGGTQAFYQPATDTIQLPPRELFTGTPTSTATESYYAVLLHELTHWTGHTSRCDRELGRRFGADAYAMEELVAELGATFACAELGLAPEPRADHAHYLDHWLRVLRADKRAVFTAASKASAAVEYLNRLARPAPGGVLEHIRNASAAPAPLPC